MADARSRRGYLDWLRGLAVLIMIHGHVMDSWTADLFRNSRAFSWDADIRRLVRALVRKGS
jgi:uncharacterized membrane protein